MARFTRAELEAFNGSVVPDLLGERVRLLFVGINPGLWTAAVGAHFARRGNRFYPALHRAGLVDREIDASDGYHPEDLDHLESRGIGITNLVARASARADELKVEELTAGADRLVALIERVRPRVVAVLGITAYRAAFRRPKAVTGRQDERPGDAELWVVPNPSGLNAHDTIHTLAAAYRAVGIAAGLVAED
ncbi:TDG/mug DNA glycosylase family protein [Nakamurella sp. UYEF19]|uniref:mismatch-specific DNA-glycosylase n=1 Tax=Nakamurella sp. UYEF19 TaxID=1756392 RepID=UPI003395F753